MVHEDFRNNLIWSQINNNVLNSQNIALIGRYVQGLLTDEEGHTIGFIEGKVEYVDFATNPPALIVGTDRVYPSNILSVADGPMVLGSSINFFHEGSTMTGTIEDIRVNSTNPTLVINAGGEEFIRPFDRINFLTEALRLQREGHPVRIGNNVAPVNNVTVNAGAVWISNGGTSITFEDFRNSTGAAAPPQNGGAPPNPSEPSNT
jgi:hypothetical protein